MYRCRDGGRRSLCAQGLRACGWRGAGVDGHWSGQGVAIPGHLFDRPAQRRRGRALPRPGDLRPHARRYRAPAPGRLRGLARRAVQDAAVVRTAVPRCAQPPKRPTNWDNVRAWRRGSCMRWAGRIRSCRPSCIAISCASASRSRLSEIFVVSDQPDALGGQPYGMASYYDVLVRNSFGNYRQLLEEVTLHPVMGTVPVDAAATRSPTRRATSGPTRTSRARCCSCSASDWCG